ncbi:hypothetical protein ACDI16_12470 [Oceanobacillus caeni]
MNEKEIRSLIESYPNLLARQGQLQKRLISLSGSGALQEESLMQRLEETDEQIERIDRLIFDSDFLTDKEVTILDLRSTGYQYDRIGKFFSLSKERIRQILNGAYKKIATNQ